MTRVSDNNTTASLNFAINKTKSKLENLQMKGATLKDVTRPSDNPMANVEALQISSIQSDNKQYIKNINNAAMQLSLTEKALEQVSDLLLKAKEIALAQASDFYDEDIRQNVASEAIQLRNQLLSIANKRIGNRFIFGGYSTLKKPFDVHGNYFGDNGHINLEIAKDHFVPINLHGEEIFYTQELTQSPLKHPLDSFPQLINPPLQFDPSEDIPKENGVERDLASIQTATMMKKGDTLPPPIGEQFHSRDNLFTQLTHLISALETNDSKSIQNLLEKFDNSISRVITLRTKVGSLQNTVNNARSAIEGEQIDYAARKSQLVDADIAEVFSELAKQQDVLKTTYKSGQTIMNKTLLDFLS